MRIRQASKYSPQIGEVLQSFIPTKFRRIVHIYTKDPVFWEKAFRSLDDDNYDNLEKKDVTERWSR